MELICEKYNEKTFSEDAQCSHPGEYCKFRTSCMIHFLEKEKDLEQRNKQKENKDADAEL